MRILVIEDTQYFIEQAKTMLADHELTICTSYKEAEEKLTGDGHWYKEDTNFPFDVVLTDLHLPISFDGISDKVAVARDTFIPTTEMFGRQIPYGIIFALVAIRRGVPVAIVSDGNHHGSPMSWALDLIGHGSPVIGKHKFVYHEGKDWGKALQQLLD